MIPFHLTGDALWQRMERAVQKVQERLERTAAALEQAGQRAGVEVLEPVAAGAIPPSGFSDGFHLNEAGAARYTAALAPALRHAILGKVLAWQ